MSQRDTAPLTKADGKMILEIMNKILGRMDTYDLGLQEMRVEAKEMEQRMHDRFKLATELIRSDLFDVKGDRIAQHDDTLADHTRRIVRIERKLAM